jgi:hypothetical protein
MLNSFDRKIANALKSAAEGKLNLKLNFTQKEKKENKELVEATLNFEVQF